MPYFPYRFRRNRGPSAQLPSTSQFRPPQRSASSHLPPQRGPYRQPPSRSAQILRRVPDLPRNQQPIRHHQSPVLETRQASPPLSPSGLFISLRQFVTPLLRPLQENAPLKVAAAVSGVLVLVLILFTVGPPAPAPVTLPQVETPVQQPAPPVPDPRIQELERYTQEHPNVYDLTSYTAHTELRNLYSLADPSEKIQAMEETDFILEHWPMDPVALHSLAVWPGERAMNITLMQVSLLKNVTDYPQFRFLAAASYLAVGDLYAKMGDYPHARAFYDLVSGDHSSDLDQYRRLARKRLDALGIGTPNR